MQNILVTGGCGFIGSNFVRFLLDEAGFTGRVVNFDKLTYAGNPESLADIAAAFPQRYAIVHADICDRAAVRDGLRTLRDRHGLPLRGRIARGPLDRGAGCLHPAPTSRARSPCSRWRGSGRTACALFHHVSTDEVYGSLGPEGRFTEDTAYRPNSPYSASKAGSDHLVRAYDDTYGLPVTISNCSNNYGPYQFPEKLIPLDDPERARGQAAAGLRTGAERARLALRDRSLPGGVADHAGRAAGARLQRRRALRDGEHRHGRDDLRPAGRDAAGCRVRARAAG